ncbi:MAG TPA: MlrC C-terminal domain-containing protein, partial [Nitrolancea sp.]|nr:MlrC C-terminal domain-containing protein [Nitrolancea sp.]
GQITLDHGESVDLGRVLILNVAGRHGGEVEVIVSEIGVEPLRPEIFNTLGVDLSRKQIIALKSSSRFREAFAAHASRFVATTTPGNTTPVFGYFDYRRLRRPTYPLDEM